MDSPLDSLISFIATILERSKNNLVETFATLNTEKLIRLVVIVGAYLLFRPYLLKFSSRAQMAQHEKEEKETARLAALSPNDLRGKLAIPADSDDEDEPGAATGADWGKNARKRQRAFLRDLMDKEEERLRLEQEDEEDKDIEEFLVK